MLVRFEDPHVPIPKISQKRAEVLARNFASPDSFSVIDISIIVNVLLVDAVLGRISHKYEVFSGQ